jgi:hypothetical protein
MCIHLVHHWRSGSDMEVHGFEDTAGSDPTHYSVRVWVIWRRNYWVAAGPLAIMLAAAGPLFLTEIQKPC